MLSEEQIRDVENFLIDNLSADALNDFHLYKNNKNFFQKLFSKQIVNLQTFWGLAERHHSELAKLAMKLNSIPASSAQLERLFSNWSFIHSRLRNRLSSENSKKLTYIYYHLKIRDENRSDEY